MTIYEHAMVGINGALALGLARRHGWQIAAWAGLAAVLPDFDGLTILLGPQCYAEGHRLWGHNLLVAGLVAAALSAAAYYTDVLVRLQRWLAKRRSASAAKHREDAPQRWGGSCTATTESAANSGPAVQLPAQHPAAGLVLWIVVGVVAAYSHLLMDVAFSAGRGLPIWGVPLFWPFSNAVYAYPLVRWGDVGATLIFAASMFAMLRWPARLQAIAAASLLAVAAYMAFRGLSG
jgi:membrane-bound metal-dependent hydrolase YbcI (DUF457 family)